MSNYNNQIPEYCPLDPTLKTSAIKCAACCYCKSDKFSLTHWCNVDRIDKGLEPRY